jgi:hypothetical protein
VVSEEGQRSNTQMVYNRKKKKEKERRERESFSPLVADTTQIACYVVIKHAHTFIPPSHNVPCASKNKRTNKGEEDVHNSANTLYKKEQRKGKQQQKVHTKLKKKRQRKKGELAARRCLRDSKQE